MVATRSSFIGGHMNEAHIAGGTWKFEPTVSKEVVFDIAKTLAEGKDKDQYLDIHVRRGKENWYIGFQYLLADRNVETYERFLKGLLHVLKLRLGTVVHNGKPQPRGVLSARISPNIIKIK
jgi:hypothetical protein